MTDFREGLPFKASAKVNFGLRISERRTDGFHTIETVFHRVNLYDEITLEPNRRICVESTDAAAPSDASNLCHKAAALLQQAAGVETGVLIHVRKHIPVGAGLGGGSADAAKILRELPGWWGTNVDKNTLFQIALHLGSDVPFFLGEGSAYALGRGEILEYFDLDVPYAILVCSPGVSISSRWAYQQIRPKRRGELDLRTLVQEGMKHPEVLRNEVVNDFESPVYAAYPAIRELKDTLEQSGAVFASLSGSGSSVYGLFPNEKDAEAASRTMMSRGCGTSVTPPHFKG
jgi:4-diphosphocytidyl-2-C-methyl-D-erythritol kinase